MPWRFRCLFAILLITPISLLAEDWEKLEHCKFEDGRYSDGDSFFVSHKGDTHCFRLILCDTPETTDEFPDRVKAQEKTFGVNHKQLFKIAEEATEFTKKTLRKPFTVYTKWEDAAGVNKRFYAYVISHDGKDLTKELVSRGYSTAFGKWVQYFDGTTSHKLFQEVKMLEQEARRKGVGIWELSGQSDEDSNDSEPTEFVLPKAAIPVTEIEKIKEMSGKVALVSGEVSRVGQTRTGSITFINFEGSQFTGVVFEANREAIESQLGSSIKEALEDKVVTLQGKISSYQKTPQIKITDHTQINLKAKDLEAE